MELLGRLRWGGGQPSRPPCHPACLATAAPACQLLTTTLSNALQADGASSSVYVTLRGASRRPSRPIPGPRVTINLELIAELSLPPSYRFRTIGESGGPEVSSPPLFPRLTIFPTCADGCCACATAGMHSDVFVDKLMASSGIGIVVGSAALQVLPSSSACGRGKALGRRSEVKDLLRLSGTLQVLQGAAHAAPARGWAGRWAAGLRHAG